MTQPNTNNSDEMGASATPKLAKTALSKQVVALREKLAAIEHERWADWQTWCHQVLRAELEKVLQRWDKQIATPYTLLTPAEKASDMEQVERYWPLIEQYAAQEANKARTDICVQIDPYIAPEFRQHFEELVGQLKAEKGSDG